MRLNAKGWPLPKINVANSAKAPLNFHLKYQPVERNRDCGNLWKLSLKKISGLTQEYIDWQLGAISMTLLTLILLLLSTMSYSWDWNISRWKNPPGGLETPFFIQSNNLKAI